MPAECRRKGTHPGPARDRCSASARTQRRLLNRPPPKRPGPREQPSGAQTPARAAPGLELPGDAGGTSPPAASAGRPPLTSPRAPAGARPRSRGRGRWSCSAAARRGAARRAGSPARGRTAAGPVRGGRRHVTREAGAAGSGGRAAGAGS